MEDQINAYFVGLFREARILLVSQSGDFDRLEKMSEDFASMHSRLIEITTLMNNLKGECHNRAVEIREDAELKKTLAESEGAFPFVIHGKHKNMSWGDLADIEDRREAALARAEEIEAKLLAPILEEPETPRPEYKTLDNFDGVSLPKEIKLSKVSKLSDLPSAFSWYTGDQTHRAGIYMRIDNLFLRVPLPEVIDSANNFARNKTIKCKYESESACMENRKFLANKYFTETRECLFAHHGDKYTKVGANFRCPINPRFGNHRHLSSDIASIKANDIKPLLMYALSDLALCFIWNDYHHPADRMVFSDVEICQ